MERGRGGITLSFRDIGALKVFKALIAQGVSTQTLRRDLFALRKRLPASVSLSSMNLTVIDGRVAVRQHGSIWCASSGQCIFEFAAAANPTEVNEGILCAMPLHDPVSSGAAASEDAAAPEGAGSAMARHSKMPVAITADEWFDKALNLEESDREGAIVAYECCLALGGDNGATWINLGRLYAEVGRSAKATNCFRRALALSPSDATALYNLGVVAQDGGQYADAMRFYRQALEAEPGFAEAHYNLATLFDRGGDTRNAIRHINEYRKLTRQRI